MPPSLPACGEYRLARGWRVFMGVAAPLLILLFVGMPLLWLRGPKPVPLLVALYCLLLLGLALLFLYGLAEAIWGRIIIMPESVTQVGTFGRRQLAWVEVKGYRLGNNYLRLLPTDTRKQPVQIGLLTERIADIVEWVAAYYPNLGPRQPAVQEPVPLVPFASPDTLSAHDIQRAEAQQTARLLNRASWIAAAWLLFLPTPYALATMACLLLPLAAIAAQWLYPGLLRPDEPDAAPAPSMAVSLLLPGVALFVRMLLDAELVSVAAIQPWAYPVGGGMALLLLAGTWKHRAGRSQALGQVAIILAAAFVYGFSAPVAYNVAFDTGAPVHYAPLLLRKYINDDEFPGFTATVQPWGPFPDSATVHVSRRYYRQLRPGSRLRVRLMPGALGIPWFRVVE